MKNLILATIITVLVGCGSSKSVDKGASSPNDNPASPVTKEAKKSPPSIPNL